MTYQRVVHQFERMELFLLSREVFLSPSYQGPRLLVADESEEAGLQLQLSHLLALQLLAASAEVAQGFDGNHDVVAPVVLDN